MSDVLEQVLSCQPPEWKRFAEYNRPYILVDVGRYTDEFSRIAADLRNVTDSSVSQIKRIQNPFLYGAYYIRKEQLKMRHGNCNVRERRLFVRVPKEQLDDLIKSNFDERKPCTSSGPCVYVAIKEIVCSRKQHDRDCDSYPEYVMYVNEHYEDDVADLFTKLLI